MMGIRVLVYATGERDENLQRSSRMADPQDHPEDAPGAAPTPPARPAAEPGPAAPADRKPPGDQTPAVKPPQKAAKKTAVKKAPAKAAKDVKKAPKAAAKKAPAKKSADRKPPAKKAAPAKADLPAAPRVETNGQLAAGAKQAAAQAKSTVEAADNPVPPGNRAAVGCPLPGAAGGRGRHRPDHAAADPTAATPLNRWP
ncbi:hypothetical protein MHEC_00620 [Mycobacterium heckeshornense]|uniref:Histone n=1 Tax=Mycobacterium heckeshornense TaxID=110505 RepID=A0A7R7GQI0_9MYCO|nr:hypothetical protein MHEC_00620 [Mycobacterium heckeshornense]